MAPHVTSQDSAAHKTLFAELAHMLHHLNQKSKRTQIPEPRRNPIFRESLNLSTAFEEKIAEGAQETEDAENPDQRRSFLAFFKSAGEEALLGFVEFVGKNKIWVPNQNLSLLGKKGFRFQGFGLSSKVSLSLSLSWVVLEEM